MVAYLGYKGAYLVKELTNGQQQQNKRLGQSKS